MQGSKSVPVTTIGVDVSDRRSQLCVLDESGEIVEEARLPSTEPAFRRRFGSLPPARVILEVGPHSPWMSRLVRELDHEVVVANPRKLRMIYENDRKSDRADAEYLARVGRMDPSLLAPVVHRSERAQADLAIVRSRSALVETRTALVNHVRSTVKALGGKLPKCSTKCFHEKVQEHVPEPLRPALQPVLESIAALNEQIRAMEKRIEELAEEIYPETMLLTQVDGVGTITALTYVLTLETPSRFDKSRSVGAYLGLVPAMHDSGDSSPQLRTTKAGDGMLRTLLVQAAHHILGPFGKDSDLRRWGERLIERGGSHAKRRAIVAVARKLSVLLHRLWVHGEVYDPLYQARRTDPELAQHEGAADPVRGQAA